MSEHHSHQESLTNPKESVPHRRFVERLWPQNDGVVTEFGFLAKLSLVLGFGLLAGFGELGLLLIRQVLWNPATFGNLQLNHHFYWMIPVSNALLFLAVGSVVTLVSTVFCSKIWSFRWVLLFSSWFCLLTWLLTAHGLHAAASFILSFGLALRLSQWLELRSFSLRKAIRWKLVVGLISIGCMLGWSQWQRGSEARALAQTGTAPKTPNLLWIVLDTVRADHLSSYGYERNTTPNLTRLAKRGLTFESVRSPAPWTLPSHATMFTGLWPHQLEIGQNSPLRDRFDTVAEGLRDQGYATAGFVANTYYCNAWFGVNQGFLHYEDIHEQDRISWFELARNCELGQRLMQLGPQMVRTRLGAIYHRKSAEEINQATLDWMARKPTERPFFVFLNYLDAHDPYVSPGAQRPFRPSLSSEEFNILNQWHNWPKKALDANVRSLIVDAYDDCLTYLDEQLGRLFDRLEQDHLLDNTLVIITSDHGEEFGEHQFYLHGNSLYGPSLNVPLIMFTGSKFPSPLPANQRVSQPVTIRDLPATVMDLFGMARVKPFPGQSLARFWSGDQNPSPEDFVFSEVRQDSQVPASKRRHYIQPALRGAMQSFVTREHIYIRGPEGTEELYNRELDPGETRDLANLPESQAILERFRSRLGQMGPF